MAEDEGTGGGRRAVAPPTIALPPRFTYESLFVGRPEASPGPLTLVSSFFAEDPDSDCRSFSQLLAGAMASPVAGRAAGDSSAASVSAASAAFASASSCSTAAGGTPPEGVEKEKGPAGVRPVRPLGVMVAPSPFFTVPPGLSPARLLESPAFGPEPFGMTHQQALAQVTVQAVQAAQASAHMQIQVEHPPGDCGAVASSMHLAKSSVNSAFLQQTQNLTSNTMATASETDGFHSDQRSQAVSLVDKPTDDGYHWRKYGQKQVKSSEYPRSYYKCTHPDCPVKKKVERNLDGQETEIIYNGQHNHPRPPPNKRSKDGPSILGGPCELNGSLDVLVNPETDSQHQIGSLNGSGDHMASGQISRRDQESGQATGDQFSGSSDGEEAGVAEVKKEEGDDSEHDFKRRKMDTRVIDPSSSQRTVTEPRIIVQTTSEVDLLDDGYRWRKYGQKVVKGNPYPRSYYKCTTAGCNVRKHVERASTDPKAVITTYEGKHNHDIPAARNSSHNTASAGAAVSPIRPKVQNLTSNRGLHKITDFKSNNQQPVAVLWLKEEHEIT